MRNSSHNFAVSGSFFQADTKSFSFILELFEAVLLHKFEQPLDLVEIYSANFHIAIVFTLLIFWHLEF